MRSLNSAYIKRVIEADVFKKGVWDTSLDLEK